MKNNGEESKIKYVIIIFSLITVIRMHKNGKINTLS